MVSDQTFENIPMVSDQSADSLEVGDLTTESETMGTDQVDQPQGTEQGRASQTAPHKNKRGEKTNLPERIGGYDTIGRLGEGSFGVVLKCRDTKLDRLVAIKLQKLNPLQERARVDRFLLEAKSAAQLRHPNIVPVFEFGEFAGNQYIVYEFIDGQQLDHWLKNNPQASLRQQIEMLAQMADALHYAHSMGIVHRDIKPANILIDVKNEPHVADFGCAKQENVNTEHTIDGAMMGTPAYMSPEVTQGFANRADGQADVWALGVILYELLVGHRPFQGKLSEMFHQIANTEPKRPRQIDPKIPVDLETITLKCMEKDRHRRMANCQDLADDLRCWLDGRPIKSRRVGVFERTMLWAKRNPSTASLLAAIAACLVLLAVGSLLYSVNIRLQQQEILSRRIDALGTAAPEELPGIIADLQNLGAGSIKQVQERQQGETDPFPFQLAVVGLTKNDSSANQAALTQLTTLLTSASPGQIKAALQVSSSELKSATPTLWEIVQNPDRPELSRLKAACVLANAATNHENWDSISPAVTRFLLAAPADQVPDYCEMLQPVAKKLRATTLDFYSDPDDSVNQRAALIASWLYQDDVPTLIQLGLQGHDGQLQRLKRAFQYQAQTILATLQRPESDNEHQLCNYFLIQALCQKLTKNVPQTDQNTDWMEPLRARGSSPLNPIRYQMIERIGLSGVDVELLESLIVNHPWQQRREAKSDPQLMGLVLALNGYDRQQLFKRRTPLEAQLLQLFQQHFDVGVHSACRFVLQQWGAEESLATATKQIQSTNPIDGFTWHEDPSGICFAIFDAVNDFAFGPQKDSQKSVPNVVLAERKSIPRRFGISTHELNFQQFADIENKVKQRWAQGEKFFGNEAELAAYLKTLNQIQSQRMQDSRGNPITFVAGHPMNQVTWRDVALYCRGLDDLMDVAKDQNVYELSFQKRTWRAKPFDDSLSRTGYRLPTSAEWEYACRADSSTRFFFGEATSVLDSYVTCIENSRSQPRPVGSLKPNLFGMFDMQGNVAEWCHDTTLENPILRRVRDQHFDESSDDFSVFREFGETPAYFSEKRGFRVARTYSEH